MHWLIVLAVFFTGVSPACSFMAGGTSVIQICAADGSVQNIAVDAAFDPFADPAPQKQSADLSRKCPFCFTHAHLALDMPDAPDGLAFLSLPAGYLAVGGGIWVPDGLRLGAVSARGPPVFS
ncbi:MAG: DUF2946 family protein [Bdellovibrionales bacterium]